MKCDDPLDMEETIEDEDCNISKNISSTILKTDDGMGTNSNGNENDDGVMDFEYNTNPEVCIISIDSLKYGEYKQSPDLHVVRVTQKEILIDAVTFHERSLQIDFHCLLDSDPILLKYEVDKSVQLIWHAELAHDIIPEECQMRSDDREYVLKKRDPNQWTSGLLQCNSSSALSALRSSSTTTSPHTSRPSISYRYIGSTADRSGLPPTGQSSNWISSHGSKYQRTSYYPTSRIAYSAQNFNFNTYGNYPSTTLRSQSTSSVLRRSSSSSLFSSASSASSNIAQNSLNDSQHSTGSALKQTIPPSSSPTSRPTAKVLPYDEQGTVVDCGFTGLRNIGNTCFMNSTLQMLVNCKELQVYFSGGYYKRDINIMNPLGFGGRLAEVFAEFMKQMWNGMNRAYEPTKIKELVAEKATQFANFAQHDAHEFLSFVLDGLHEDLNRVRVKPTTNTIEAEGRPDIEVSREAWHNHLLRNDSIFVDLFHGQLKSRLQCPKCNQISITFDPFAYLAVPFPKEKRSSTVYFWPLDPCLKPVRIIVRYNADGKISEVLDALSRLVNVNPKSMRIIEVNNHRIVRVYNPDDSVNNILTTDIIYVFQVHDPYDCNDDIVEFAVVQRLLYRKGIGRACAFCHATDVKLKTCERCYDAFYCNRECQVKNWPDHKIGCRSRTQAEAVGQPFIISLPKKRATYSNIMRNLESRCKHSVNVFQPPVENNNDAVVDPLESSRESYVGSSSCFSASAINGNIDDLPVVPVAAKRQMVLGEPRNKSRTESKLFLVRKLQQSDAVFGDTLVDSRSDTALDLPNGTFLSINWWNLKCGKEYLTVETKRDVDVDIEKTAYYQKMSSSMASSSSIASNPSLYDMLAMFSETERLKPEESWYCSKCKEHVEATKQLVLYRLPPILIIQLKRFIYTTSLMTVHRRSKDDRPVRYPLDNLDLAQFLSDTAPSGQETKYDLTGVVCHSGSSYFGHYISLGRLLSIDGKTIEIDWRNFDDSIVTRAQLSRVQNDDAYLLFYKQRGRATQDLLKKHYGIG
ncbi:Ubiquitin carboxyl-terminal hydrolase family protein [Brugia malayi]|uniref:ubiquitinyl hydrolase 1 n=4 Tax=Brugia TaxID=6278 RepID=A0A0K0J930_BRUMA|nr:Ubiquitin carboxyl-terminal hydrolase family protein [Brugia malayi]CRZ22962.1 Bm3163 [Brugia malayi]VIO94805.1 Ubiquitin carboxyl-terminal hydrolase family protein [Brugia malayi]